MLCIVRHLTGMPHLFTAILRLSSLNALKIRKMSRILIHNIASSCSHNDTKHSHLRSLHKCHQQYARILTQLRTRPHWITSQLLLGGARRLSTERPGPLMERRYALYKTFIIVIKCSLDSANILKVLQTFQPIRIIKIFGIPFRGIIGTRPSF